jgi:hypothetical protein
MYTALLQGCLLLAMTRYMKELFDVTEMFGAL